MAKIRIGARALATLLLWGGAGSAYAAPTVAQMLQFVPRQPGVEVTTPAEAEQSACRVELIKGVKNAQGKTPSGWLLRDAQRRPVRCFLDTDGDDKIDLWCYYRDGNEAYREIDANFNGKPDEYRWLGPNGSRWGTDADEDGRIDAWKAISPEEVSQEVLRAVITRDFKRLQALMITKAELDALDLPEAEASRIRDKLSQAGIKFQKTAAGLIHLSERTRWVHLETEPPECLPADSLGSRADLVRYRYGSILYENDGKHDWLQTGEMIQVGRAWRITDAPVAGSRFEQVSGEHAEGVLAVGPEVRPLLEELRKVDEAGPAGGDPAETARHSLARAAVLEKIVAASPAEQKPQWVRQLADSLASAAQNGDDAAYKKLVRLRDRLAAEAKGDNLAGYVAFREMSADYSRRLREADPEETAKVQEHWQERLKQFVNDYPGADDAPEALMQLGMVSEFTGKETEARNWYTQLVKHHPRHLLAARAAGAVRRLDLEGKPLELSGPVLGTQEPFDISRLRGKVVIVYYWASWNQQTASDFARLKGLLDAHEGVELVTVNLDTGDAEAINFLRGHPVPGTHLHQPPGGLESPLATQYGVLVLPNMFLVGKDGKVVNRNAQIVTLEDDLKKLTK